MKIIKLLETSIDIPNPVSVYADPDKKIIEILAAKFEGRCYKGCLINRIIGIKQRSHCEVNRFSDPNVATVNVMFEVDALVLNNGEIINGCRIVNRNNNIIILAKDDNIKLLTFDPDNKFGALKPGSLVSVVVGAARYNVNSRSIAANTRILTFPVQKFVYSVPPNSAPNAEGARLLKEARDRLSTIMKDADGAKLIAFYETLLTPFNDPVKRLKGATVVKLEDALRAGGNIVMDSRLPLDSFDVILAEGDDNEYHKSANVPSAEAAIFEIISDMVARVNTICDYAEIYNTREIIKNYAPLWDVFRSAKV